MKTTEQLLNELRKKELSMIPTLIAYKKSYHDNCNLEIVKKESGSLKIYNNSHSAIFLEDISKTIIHNFSYIAYDSIKESMYLHIY